MCSRGGCRWLEASLSIDFRSIMMVATVGTRTGDGVTHYPGTQYLARVELIRDGWATVAHGGLDRSESATPSSHRTDTVVMNSWSVVGWFWFCRACWIYKNQSLSLGLRPSEPGTRKSETGIGTTNDFVTEYCYCH